MTPPDPPSDAVATPIQSPCVKTCAVDGSSGLCVGCLRTLAEIAAWSSFTAERRAEIMAGLESRRNRLGANPPAPFTG